MSTKSILLFFVISVTPGRWLHAQTDAVVDDPRMPRITLQLCENVQLESHIVRVGDVVKPVGNRPIGWDEVADKAIGLIPPGGQLRMERQRIGECLDRSKLLHEPVRWTGSKTISISYVVPEKSAIENPLPNIQQAAYITNKYTSVTAVRQVRADGPEFKRLLPAERNRVERMIMAALQTTHADVLEQYEISIAGDERGIHSFHDLRAVRSLRFGEAPSEGPCSLEITGDAELNELVGTVTVELIKLPIVAFTTGSLNRGDVITARDVIMKPIARQNFDDRQVTDPSLIYDKEITRTLSADKPFNIMDISEPIVIKRGDRVELRVVGAGVTVVTEGKALAPAAAGESIMVETETPKQKIAARAVRAGLVEIVTRPPQIEPK
jgi:flagella basal body P-ring formation protein FlgA